MEIHQQNHHNAYLTKFKAAIDGTPLADQDLETILSKTGQRGAAVRNQGGGYLNHIIFWESLAPNSGGKPEGKLGQANESSFGSFNDFQSEFPGVATKLVGYDRV